MFPSAGDDRAHSLAQAFVVVELLNTESAVEYFVHGKSLCAGKGSHLYAWGET